MKKGAILLAAMIFGFSTIAAHADELTLKGSKVRAVLFFDGGPIENFFNDPADMNPSLDQIGSGKEFTYDDGIATYSANFNATKLTVRVNCDAGISLKKCNTEPEFVMEFKDNLFADAEFNVVSDSLGAVLFSDGNPKDFGVTDPFLFTAKNSTLILDITPTPEPSSIVLMGTGLLGFLGCARRRFFA